MTVTRFSPRKKVSRDKEGGVSIRTAPSPSPAIRMLSRRNRSLLNPARRSMPGASSTWMVTALALSRLD